MSGVFIFGNSHVACMQQAQKEFGTPNSASIAIVNLNHYKELLAPPENMSMSDLILKLRNEEEPKRPAKLLVSRLGGNEHNVIGMLEHERAFDFVLPGYEELPLRKDVEILTVGFIESVMRRRVEGSLKHLGIVAAKISVPIVHLESPPPISDSEFIQSNLDSFFKAEGAMPAVTPIDLRYKLWKLQCRLADEMCSEMDVGYAPSPAEIFDENEYLHPRYYGNDVTHGNSLYGELLNKLAVELAITQSERP